MLRRKVLAVDAPKDESHEQKRVPGTRVMELRLPGVYTIQPRTCSKATKERRVVIGIEKIASSVARAHASYPVMH